MFSTFRDFDSCGGFFQYEKNNMHILALFLYFDVLKSWVNKSVNFFFRSAAFPTLKKDNRISYFIRIAIHRQL